MVMAAEKLSRVAIRSISTMARCRCSFRCRLADIGSGRFRTRQPVRADRADCEPTEPRPKGAVYECRLINRSLRSRLSWVSHYECRREFWGYSCRTLLYDE